MNLQPVIQPLAAIEASWLVLGIFEDERETAVSVRETPWEGVVERLTAANELPGALGETTPVLGLSGPGVPSILVVGLGPRAEFGPGAAFEAGVAAGKRLGARPRETVALALARGEADDPLATAASLVAGVIVGTRGPGLRKTEPSRHAFQTLQVVAPTSIESRRSALEAAVRKGRILGEAINLARDLANTPPSEKSPTRLAERAREVATEAGIAATVWDEAKIREERFGGLIGVSAGSDQPPAFVVLEYRAGGDGPTLALIGKGVTFDSGGLSLKTSASMEDMKSDMTGAAVVLASMQAVARLRLPVNLVGYLAIAENMTGGSALKLGDVLTMRDGKTVEVLNTDAEGRLILADALSYAAEGRPDRMLDLATLTGSCIVALGLQVAGLFSNNDSFRQDVEEAGRLAGERVWRLPLDKHFLTLLKSNVADLKNVGGKWGGASTAAKFLEQFVAQTPWVHLDIAGPSWSETDRANADAGGTGCFVRTIVALAESMAGAREKSGGGLATERDP